MSESSELPGLKGELNELPLTPWRVDAKRVWRGGMCLPRGPAWKESQPRPQPSSDSRQVINLMIDWNAELGAPPAARISGRGASWKMWCGEFIPVDWVSDVTWLCSS